VAATITPSARLRRGRSGRRGCGCVSKPTAPACPLTVAYPALCEGRHPDTIGEKTVPEVEVLYFDLMLARCHGSTMSSCSLTGVKEASSSIRHSTYATLVVSISYSLWAGPRGVPAPAGPFLYRRAHFTILSPLMSNISQKLRYNVPICRLTLWRSMWRG
jgi:hypothetical protein